MKARLSSSVPAALFAMLAGAFALYVFTPTAALAATMQGTPFDAGALADLLPFALGGFTLNELRQKRSKLIDQMEQLTKGELTEQTRSQFDTLEAEVKTLDDDIRRAQLVEDTRRAAAAAQASQGDLIEQRAQQHPVGGGAVPVGEQRAEPATRIIGNDGDSVRALTLRQSVRSAFLPDHRNGQRDDLNLGRYFRGMVTGDWAGAELERRAMSEGVLADGGYTVPTVLSADVIDAARNQTRVLQAGALTIPMTSQTMRIARVLTDPAPGWKAENAAMAEGAMTFEPVDMKARTLAVLVKLSRELFMDSANVESVVRNALAAGLALELDRVALFGTGVGEEPKGLLNTTGIQTVTVSANGDVLTSYDPFSIAVEKVAEANGQANAVIFSPRTAGTLDRMKDSTGQPLMAPESFKALTKLPTKQVPNNLTHGTATNASVAVVGEYPNLLVAVRENLVIEMSNAAGDAFSKMQVWIRAFLRADIAVARPDKFCTVPGIIPAP
ncbi:phage major capsid protein [Azospirillum sp. YIM B02556]|uniref:Phage major capsid protein n=1 Tax=Azospirillum endophyticum TaxID=2800326 RepID=A0ABS1F982_9PROT|nr:phage major capsid protein [Azospirillum endophyticum]MBK1839965.1 phage major capsid protein [Azospirillum endophyticum]